MQSERILSRSTICLWIGICLLPLVGFWAARVRLGTAFVQAWLPGDDVARETYREFLSNFGDDQILFVSWPDCRLDDPRLPAFSAHLTQLAEQRAELGVLGVKDSAGMLDQLVDGPNEFTREDAAQRLQGFAIGADGSCFIALQVTDASSDERALLIRTLRREAERVINIDASDLILAGDPFQVYVIDQASRDTMSYFVAPSSVIALVFAWICLRRLRITLLVFLFAGLGQLIGLALIAFFLREMSAVMVVLPTLIFMLTLSAAIHLTNYYRDCGGDAVPTAGAAALALGARPCALATLTTVFGFGSLIVSQLQPVWQFGSLASLGLLLSTVALLSAFPAAISLRVGRYPARADVRLEPPVPIIARWIARLTSRFANLITLAGIVLLLASAAGVPRLKTSTEFEDMFLASSPAMVSLHWMEEHLGPINSLEFLISYPKDAAAEVDLLERLTLLADIHRELQSSRYVTSVLSAVTVLPTVPEGRGTRNTVRRAVLRRTLESRLDYLSQQHLVADLADSQIWRLSARVGDLAGDDYRLVQANLLSAVRQCIHAADGDPHLIENTPVDATLRKSGTVSVTVTGLRAVIEKAHFVLLSDLGGSFITAFLLIAPVMMLIVRGFVSGLVLMVPNILPVVLVFGCMGWLEIKLDVASILTASVALGIAVDDTLHFITWYLRGRGAGDSATESVRQAISSCARPMLHTTIICTGSMLPFFFCDFLPTSKFALLMILILSGAILGDLILLPALLQSSLGRLVYRPIRTLVGDREKFITEKNS